MGRMTSGISFTEKDTTEYVSGMNRSTPNTGGESMSFTEFFITYQPVELKPGEADVVTMEALTAMMGNLVTPTFSKDLKGIQLNAYVSTDGIVTVQFLNLTNNTISLDSGTLKVNLIKK